MAASNDSFLDADGHGRSSIAIWIWTSNEFLQICRWSSSLGRRSPAAAISMRFGEQSHGRSKKTEPLAVLLDEG
ncbi:hypothetical protein NL676_025615 [Syzygium grande]|nr:hypothetical protein NL676_025615 [Syzygium grande]